MLAYLNAEWLLAQQHAPIKHVTTAHPMLRSIHTRVRHVDKVGNVCLKYLLVESDVLDLVNGGADGRVVELTYKPMRAGV